MRKWTLKIEEDFISHYKQYEFLWNQMHPDRYKFSKKYVAFEKISESLSSLYPEDKELFTLNRLIAKAKNFRSYYRYLKKEKDEGRALPSKPEWDHFKRLSFLGDALFEPSRSNIKRKRKANNSQNRPSRSDTELAEDPSTCDTQMLNAESPLEDDDHFQPAPKSRKGQESIASLFLKFSKVIEKLRNADTSVDALYARYIAARMAQIKSPQLKGRLRVEIEEILSRYDMEDAELSELQSKNVHY